MFVVSRVDYRLLRYLAKCTIEPAITHGLSEHVGSLLVPAGQLADLAVGLPQPRDPLLDPRA